LSKNFFFFKIPFPLDGGAVVTLNVENKLVVFIAEKWRSKIIDELSGAQDYLTFYLSKTFRMFDKGLRIIFIESTD